MDKEYFYKILDIDSGEDFTDFENMAAYFEGEEEVPDALLVGLLKEVDKDRFSGLIKSYFEEFADFIPDSQLEMSSLLENISRSLAGMAQNMYEENDYVVLAKELERFRDWYSCGEYVYAGIPGEKEEQKMSVRDAVINIRAEKFTGENLEYDFSDCLDYSLDDYVMSFAQLLGEEDAE